MSNTHRRQHTLCWYKIPPEVMRMLRMSRESGLQRDQGRTAAQGQAGPVGVRDLLPSLTTSCYSNNKPRHLSDEQDDSAELPDA